MLTRLIVRHAAGWPEFDPDHDPVVTAAERLAGQTRALAMGAKV